MHEEYRGWLLQVLQRRPKTEYDKRVDQVYSFGGGGSGFSKEAWEIIHGLFSFEYMGSAEYEFGAPAKAFQEIVKLAGIKKLVRGQMVVKAKDIKMDKFSRGNSNYDPTVKKRGQPSKLPPPKDVSVYFICEEGREADVQRIIKAVAKDTQRCKDSPRGSAIFDPVSEHDKNYIGWLSVTDREPFLALIDKPTFDDTVKAFGAREP
jgi:hypothetical protein